MAGKGWPDVFRSGMRGGNSGNSARELPAEAADNGPLGPPPFMGWLLMEVAGGGERTVLTGRRLGVRLSSLLFIDWMDWVRAVNSLTGTRTTSSKTESIIWNEKKIESIWSPPC